MKTLLFIILIFSSANCISQVIHVSGKITDAETGKVIQGALVYFKGSWDATATNTHGQFTISSSSPESTTLVIATIPYEPVEVKVPSGSQQLELKLEKLKPTRSAVLTSAHALEYVVDAIEKIPANYSSSSGKTTTFAREHVKSFNNIIQYFEAVVEEDAEGSTVKDGFYMEDKYQRDIFWNSRTGGFYTFGWSMPSASKPPSKDCFLGVRLKESLDIGKYYTFIPRGIVKFHQRKLYVIDFDQQNIKASLLKGTMYLDSATGAIVKLKYALSPKGYGYISPNRSIDGIICKAPMKVEVMRNEGEINYWNRDGQWAVTNSFHDVQFIAGFDSVSFEDNKHYLKLHSELLVTGSEKAIASPGDSNHETASLKVLKDRFERYPQENAPVYNNMIRADTSVEKISNALLRANKAWERIEGRKAKEELISKTTFSPAELQTDLDYLRRMLESLHPDLYKYASEGQINSTFSNVRNRINHNMTEDRFLKLLSPMIAKFRCQHTELLPSSLTKNYLTKFGKSFPEEVRVTDRRMFISDKLDSGEVKEVVKINGQPVANILLSLEDKLPFTAESSRERDYAMGSHFSSLYLTFIDQPDTFHLDLKNSEPGKIERKAIPSTPFNYSNHDKISYSEVDSLQTAILKLPSFECREFVESMRTAFESLQSKRFSNLVIDLRDNSSSSASAATLLYSYIAGMPFRLYEGIYLKNADASAWENVMLGDQNLFNAIPDFSARISSTDSAVLFNNDTILKTTEPKPDAFAGNVYILINEGTASAAAELAASVKASGRGIIVGNDIPLSFNGSISDAVGSFTLPNSGVRVVLPLARHRLAGEANFLNEKLVPDYSVEKTRENLFKDAEMEKCLEMILQNCCTAKSD